MGGATSFDAGQRGLDADRQPEHGPRPGPPTAAASTTVVNHRVFSAYGQVLSQTIPGTNPLQPAAVDCLFAYRAGR